VARIDTVRIVCFVAQDDLDLLRVGQPAWVRVGRGGDEREELPARVSRVSQSVDPVNGLFRVELQAANPRARLKPGTVVEASVRVDRREDVLAVPAEAVVERSGRQVVFLVRGGRARLLPVTLGIDDGERVEARGGIQAGDTLVVRGQHRLSDGARVRIVGGADR
jgi:RND family efflux transporter MFP subunit